MKSSILPMPGLVTLEVFLLADELHQDYHLPFLRRPGNGTQSYYVVNTTVRHSYVSSYVKN